MNVYYIHCDQFITRGPPLTQIVKNILYMKFADCIFVSKFILIIKQKIKLLYVSAPVAGGGYFNDANINSSKSCNKVGLKLCIYMQCL